MYMRTRLRNNERGAALLETAITIPIILLICVGIFEFGRAYQTWQVLTNAAREGARVAILSDKTDAEVKTAITTKFTRAWPFVLYAAALLTIGLFSERAYCRFLCPLGGVLAVLVAIRRRRLTATLTSTGRLVAGSADTRELLRSAPAASRFAYGPAIAAGTIVAALVG